MANKTLNIKIIDEETLTFNNIIEEKSRHDLELAAVKVNNGYLSIVNNYYGKNPKSLDDKEKKISLFLLALNQEIELTKLKLEKEKLSQELEELKVHRQNTINNNLDLISNELREINQLLDNKVDNKIND